MTHGYTAEMSQWLRDNGWHARAIPHRLPTGAEPESPEPVHVQSRLFDAATDFLTTQDPAETSGTPYPIKPT